MAAPPAPKRARPAALNAAVTTLAVRGLGKPRGIFVLADGNRLVASSSKKTIFQLPPSGRLATLAGNKDELGNLKDGDGISARFKVPFGLTVDRAGNVVVADFSNNALRTVTRAGAVVRTLAGNGEAGFVDGQGPNARFNGPHSVVVAANGDFIVSDQFNHSIRVISPDGAVRTLVGNGQAGFADGQGADARLNYPCGLAMDPEGNVLVADFRNGAIRKVTMAGAVSTGK
jgi:sugar lactone lactonase YvrE